jgi:hypothetical protein
VKLSAIMLARAIALVETSDLNPRGQVFGPDLVRALVERYNFQKFPQTPDEFDEGKGVEFITGKAGTTVVEKFTVWRAGLGLETRSSTDDSKQILEGMLEWGAERFGLAYTSGMIKRWMYVSNVTFYSNVPLLALLSDPLAKLSRRTSESLSQILGERIEYETVMVTVHHDVLTRKFSPAPFSIQRRVETPFADNKYYSEAPLPTDVHIELLREFEADVIHSLPKTVARKWVATSQ